MHAPLYDLIIFSAWLVFLAIWGIGAFTKKPDVRARSAAFWIWRPILIIAIIYLGSKGGGIHVSDRLAFQASSTAGWIGAALTVIGIGIAVWARVYLGRNWSSHPNYKAEHELVTGGPYAHVRHPIYTGVLLALVGSACIGYLYTLIICVVVAVMFLARIPREERIMLTLFPDQYPAYRKRTKKLIPFIW